MKYLTLIFLILLSCGSVKKNKTFSSEDNQSSVQSEDKTETSESSSTFQNATVKIENNGYQISVKPLNGQNSFFNFTSPDGQLFSGETNAEISFEKKSEKKESSTITEKILQKTEKTYRKYEFYNVYKTISTTSEKQKSAYPWYYILFAGFMLREILRLAWNWTKKSNWYLKLIRKL